MLNTIWSKLFNRQFILYCLCGGTGVCTDMLVYYFAIQAGMGVQGANALGYMAGTLISFILNRVITFGVRDQAGKRLALFFMVAGLGYLASSCLLWLMVSGIGLDKFLAKALTLPLVVALQFGLNRKITFRTSVA